MNKLKYFIVTAFLIITVAIAKPQTVPQNTGSKITQEDAQEALVFHNNVRKDVSVQPLEWDIDMAKYAQEWADYLANDNDCNIEHRGNIGKNSKNAGENIFWGSGMDYTALDASEKWYGEIKSYTYGVLSNQNWYSTGHYTQIVWRNTKKVGIGVSKCSSGATIIVANYFPPGNYIGQKPY